MKITLLVLARIRVKGLWTSMFQVERTLFPLNNPPISNTMSGGIELYRPSTCSLWVISPRILKLSKRSISFKIRYIFIILLLDYLYGDYSPGMKKNYNINNIMNIFTFTINVGEKRHQPNRNRSMTTQWAIRFWAKRHKFLSSASV